MLKQWLEKCKSWLLPRENEIILVTVIIAVALIGFALGRISALREENFPIQISAQNPSDIQADKQFSKNQEAQLISPKIEERLLVGSKNGEIYHYPWCPGAKRIKEENKIWFNSVEEAKKAGYRQAANCPGL